MDNYLDQLDDSQREAVVYEDGPSLVVAGAGSGKTRVLTYKIAHLLKTGYQPHSILALTFTNKAAREMKGRIAAVINEYTTRYLWMGTFHSIFYRILRHEAQSIGYPPNFTIYDQTDSKNLIKTILKEMALDEKVYRPNMVQSRISHAKNSLISSNAYPSNKAFMEHDRRTNTPQIHDIYKLYETRCFQAGVMDFDDLLLQANILLRDHPDVLARYQQQFRYILVDEYQDTNVSQHRIVSRLCEQHLRIFVVGDDAQSIYSFRGANIDNMLRFKDSFPGCKIFKLEQNYRSTQNIVDAANSLISNNIEQIQKTVFSKNEKGSKITVLSTYSDYEEGYVVSSKIWDMKHESDCSFADFAVLYRTNAQSRVLEEAMRKRMINYRVYGSLSFYQRKEIKDILAYLRAIVNPNDEESIKRIINYPVRGIGNTTVDKLQHAAISKNTSLWEVIKSPLENRVEINKGTAGKLQSFQQLIEELQQKNKAMTAADIGELTIMQSGIYESLVRDFSVEGVSRLENVKELLNAMNEFVSLREEEGLDTVFLSDFLMDVSLMTDQDNEKDEQKDSVSLMTVHSAKGLEFKNVFIVGVENDLFPSQQAMNSSRAIEEERRLFYVAITRAKENCIIAYAENRFRNGQSNPASPSFFIDDIDNVYLDFPNAIVLPREKRNKINNLAWDYDRVLSYPKQSDNVNPPEINRSVKTSQRMQCRQDITHSPGRFRSVKSLDHTQGSQDLSNSSGIHRPMEMKKVESLAGFNVGDKIVHERFGEGLILFLEGKGGDAKATVSFVSAGTKNLLLKYAKIKLLSR